MEFDESGKPDEVVLDKVVLDFDPETKEPLIEVDRGLVKKLKPHQVRNRLQPVFDSLEFVVFFLCHSWLTSKRAA